MKLTTALSLGILLAYAPPQHLMLAHTPIFNRNYFTTVSSKHSSYRVVFAPDRPINETDGTVWLYHGKQPLYHFLVQNVNSIYLPMQDSLLVVAFNFSCFMNHQANLEDRMLYSDTTELYLYRQGKRIDSLSMPRRFAQAFIAELNAAAPTTRRPLGPKTFTTDSCLCLLQANRALCLNLFSHTQVADVAFAPDDILQLDLKKWTSRRAAFYDKLLAKHPYGGSAN